MELVRQWALYILVGGVVFTVARLVLRFCLVFDFVFRCLFVDDVVSYVASFECILLSAIRRSGTPPE